MAKECFANPFGSLQVTGRWLYFARSGRAAKGVLARLSFLGSSQCVLVMSLGRIDWLM